VPTCLVLPYLRNARLNSHSCLDWNRMQHLKKVHPFNSEKDKTLIFFVIKKMRPFRRINSLRNRNFLRTPTTHYMYKNVIHVSGAIFYFSFEAGGFFFLGTPSRNGTKASGTISIANMRHKFARKFGLKVLTDRFRKLRFLGGHDERSTNAPYTQTEAIVGPYGRPQTIDRE
jgi:hypothetical protein